MQIQISLKRADLENHCKNLQISVENNSLFSRTSLDWDFLSYWNHCINMHFNALGDIIVDYKKDTSSYATVQLKPCIT